MAAPIFVFALVPSYRPSPSTNGSAREIGMRRHLFVFFCSSRKLVTAGRKIETASTLPPSDIEDSSWVLTTFGVVDAASRARGQGNVRYCGSKPESRRKKRDTGKRDLSPMSDRVCALFSCASTRGTVLS